ncbi:MAG: GNAT family N-acetyltransferase [Candidatus Hodarchaeales archaeon]|jgi:ribosomal protein S18 acetylase RimI-like enzyme
MPPSDPSKRESVKLRRLFFQKINDKEKKEPSKGDFKFYVLKMSWDQGLDAIKGVEKKIEADDFLKRVEVRELNPEIDKHEFIRVYNRAFITAPDPYRSLSLNDVKHFNPKSTFVAVLYGKIIGFIFLTLEPLIKQGITLGKQGVIAGLGVDPRYRRKKVAFLLVAKAAHYFAENDVLELVCEVYHENKVSYSFIRNFGMTRTGTIYL